MLKELKDELIEIAGLDKAHVLTSNADYFSIPSFLILR